MTKHTQMTHTNAIPTRLLLIIIIIHKITINFFGFNTHNHTIVPNLPVIFALIKTSKLKTITILNFQSNDTSKYLLKHD